jgi:hypothetical protein
LQPRYNRARIVADDYRQNQPPAAPKGDPWLRQPPWAGGRAPIAQSGSQTLRRMCVQPHGLHGKGSSSESLEPPAEWPTPRSASELSLAMHTCGSSSRASASMALSLLVSPSSNQQIDPQNRRLVGHSNRSLCGINNWPWTTPKIPISSHMPPHCAFRFPEGSGRCKRTCFGYALISSCCCSGEE